LEERGFEVRFEPVDAGRLLKTLRGDPPEALVVDLSRSPAQGRDLAVAVRIHGATRRIPILFVEGAPEKVSRVKEVLPDALFTSWGELPEALKVALRSPPGELVIPESALAGYSGTPLPKKLGIKAGAQVLVVDGPGDFPRTLGSLPEGARLVGRYGPNVELILWFVRSRKGLEGGMGKWVPRVGKGGIWIIWPKKGSGILSDLKQGIVRKAGLDAGLVDYKIAAIDETWSGLKFAVR